MTVHVFTEIQICHASYRRCDEGRDLTVFSDACVEKSRTNRDDGVYRGDTEYGAHP